jgi:hypothetical protein
MNRELIEQHLKNIAFAINHDSLTVSNLDKRNITDSFNALVKHCIPELAIKPEPKPEFKDQVKAVRKGDKTKILK